MSRSKFNYALKIRQLPHGEGLPLPSYGSAGAAGMDLRAAIPVEEPVTLEPGAWRLIPCGFCMQLPAFTEAQIRPRSGLALKAGISIVNAPGTIDEDYRGEIGIVLINYGQYPFVVRRGDRIAQMVIANYVRIDHIEEVDTLSDTGRGEGGYGSTGTK